MVVLYDNSRIVRLPPLFLKEVNEMWAGLGYHRRARFLLEVEFKENECKRLKLTKPLNVNLATLQRRNPCQQPRPYATSYQATKAKHQRTTFTMGQLKFCFVLTLASRGYKLMCSEALFARQGITNVTKHMRTANPKCFASILDKM
ncbi:hypothetical protein M8C21_029551, partial [Ambrosia artemisiifolia]